jgi:uncharacterized protein (TIRG00374 family)
MTALVLYLIKSGKLDFAVFKSVFTDKKVPVFVTFALYCLVQMFYTKRYQLFINTLGYSVGYFYTFKLTMVGLFYNNFLPGGVGGDILKVYYVKKNCELPISKGIAVTFFDRVLGLLGLVFVSFTALLVMLLISKIHFSVLNEQKLLFFTIPLIPVLAVTAIFLLKVDFFYKIAGKTLGKFLFGTHLINMLDSFRTIAKNNKILLLSFALCILGHLTSLIALSSLSYLIYGKSAAVASIAVSGIVLLTGAVPKIGRAHV